MCLKSEWSYQSWRRSKLSSALCVETTRFFRRGVVRNRSAMVEYSSTITEQLLTTPRRKKPRHIFCCLFLSVWRLKRPVRRFGKVLCWCFEVGKGGKASYKLPCFSTVVAAHWDVKCCIDLLLPRLLFVHKDRLFCMCYMMFLRRWWRRRLKQSRVLCSGGLG